MLLDPRTRQLYIFAGQRHKEYLSDFYIYDIQTGQVVEMSRDCCKQGVYVRGCLCACVCVCVFVCVCVRLWAPMCSLQWSLHYRKTSHKPMYLPISARAQTSHTLM